MATSNGSDATTPTGLTGFRRTAAIFDNSVFKDTINAMPVSRHFQPSAKKALGQHFLTDASVIDRIVEAIDPQPDEHVIEIGPGRGALTLPLLRQLGVLTAIEFDRDLISPLAALARPLGALHIVQANVLHVDLASLHPSPLRLVGNLPYNISSPILFHSLSAIDAIQDMHFMLQKEVVDRMAALPGSKIYGRLSVMLQAKCRIAALFDVAPEAFSPPPKVDSAVVRLTPLPDRHFAIHDWQQFSQIVRLAFGQRRKTLRNALGQVCKPAHFSAANIDPTVRAEALDVSAFAALSNAMRL